jgi:hypothetical protein
MSVYNASWWVPVGEPITNSIQWKTYWCTGWSYVSWDTRLIVAIVFIASWWVPIGKPIMNSIQWKTYWCMGWSYVSWDTGLIVAIVFMSTRPAGGCHELLLGCYLNPLLSWSKLGSILITLACLCIKRSLQWSSLYIGITMVILACLLCCIVCCATSTLYCCWDVTLILCFRGAN